MRPLWILYFLVAASSAKIKVGLNCSNSDECEDEPPCPADSTLDPDTNECFCAPEHCVPISCPSFKSRTVLTHKSSKEPGDCCDVYECTADLDLNCTGVVCPEDGQDCPPDSSRLPKTLNEGDCCAVSHGCECFPCSQPSSCPPGQTSKVVKTGNGKPGTCCPLYECHPLNGSNNFCIVNNEEKPEGSRWKKNECSECTCIGGSSHCTSINCPPPPGDCPRMTLPKGQCCPICLPKEEQVDGDTKPKGCKEGNVIYENGATWDEDDCTVCTCKEGYKTCQAGMCQPNVNISCKVPCESWMKNSSSCPSLEVCSKKCKHGFKMDKAGCPICKCDHCKPIDNCKKRCPHGFQTDDKGCPSCKCKPSPAVNESIDKATVSSCTSEGGVLKDDGEAWFDGCRQCYCYGGKEMCALVSCPKLTCPDPISSKNSCCPMCPGNETRMGVHVVCYGPGGVKKEGETWLDGCLQCMCHAGRVMCHQEVCPPVLCTHPLPPPEGSCCPVCSRLPGLPEKNIIECGSDRPPGSKWRQDSCVSCVCSNGIADCYTQECNQLDPSCKHPLQVKNQCCPICFDGIPEENTCQVGNVTLREGDVWEVNKCKRCTCGPGRVATCMQTLCDAGCSNANSKCLDPYGHDSGGLRGIKLWMFLIFVSILVTFAFAFCTRYYCQKRHRFKICDTVPNCNYKFVATYENPPSPQKGPV